MSSIKRRHFLQLVGSAVAAAGVNQIDRLSGLHLAWAHPPTRKLALLVGINEYPSSSGLSQLRGCLTDVELQRHLLIHRYGFQPEDIATLTDQAATRQQILSTFEDHLIQQAQPGDVVVFHYSGHADRIPDPNCDRTHCLMGALAPVDAIRHDANNWDNLITRLDLAAQLEQLQTDQVTTVLDTIAGESFSSSNGFPKGVLLAASLADQLAADSVFDGFYAGAFTYALTHYLWQQQESQSFADAIADITDRLQEDTIVVQTPVLISEPNTDHALRPVYFVEPQVLDAEASLLSATPQF